MMDAGGDGRGWARMGAGRGCTRMLELVIIALSEGKKKTYLINGPARGCPLTREVVVVAVDVRWW